jgi:hypothetical protein
LRDGDDHSAGARAGRIEAVTTYDAAIEYAVYEGGGWHIADWDGECFHVTSDWQQA